MSGSGRARTTATREVEVLIVGGGVIGCAAAAELAARGHEVRLLERREDVGRGCSFANAGTIVPSHALPLANPDALREGLTSLFGSGRGIEVGWRPSPALASWGLRFARAARPPAVARALADNVAMTLSSVERLAGWVEQFGERDVYRRDGSLYAYRLNAPLSQAADEADRLRAFGIESRALDRGKLGELEPALAGVEGAILYPQDGFVNPNRLTRAFASAARDRGAAIDMGCEVLGLAANGDGLSALTQRGAIAAHVVVLASGHEIDTLAGPLGVRLPIMPAWGHSVDLTVGVRPARPVYLPDIGVMTAPTDDGIRLTTGFSLGARAPALTEAALRAWIDRCARYLPALRDAEVQRVWTGARPASPDGLPVIGRAATAPDLILAGGHGMLGMTLAAETAALVADMVEGRASGSALLSPDRFRPHSLLRRRFGR